LGKFILKENRLHTYSIEIGMPQPIATLRLLLHLVLVLSFLLPSFPARAALPEPTPPAASTLQPEPAAVTPTPTETLAPTQAITPTPIPTETLLPIQAITPTLEVTATTSKPREGGIG